MATLSERATHPSGLGLARVVEAQANYWHALMASCTPTPHPTDSDARALRDTQAEAGETGADR